MTYGACTGGTVDVLIVAGLTGGNQDPATIKHIQIGASGPNSDIHASTINYAYLTNVMARRTMWLSDVDLNLGEKGRKT